MHRTALITGASGDIGQAVAWRLAEDDYDLALLGHHNAEALESLAANIRAQTAVNVSTHIGDIADSGFVDHVLGGLPHLDIVVNNAGISYVGLLQDMSDADWRRIVDVNLGGVFYVCRAAIPLLLRSQGRIISISSVWGNVGASMEVAYSATKGGVNALTRALAKELAPSGVAVNAIACGYIDTKMNAHLDSGEREALIDQIPADRAGTPAEVADALALLASAPAYLTGQVITLDGGWT